MMKKIWVVIVVMLFLGLVFMPAFNSSYVDIQSQRGDEQGEGRKYVKFEVYEFRGKYGYIKTVKEMSLDKLAEFLKKKESIESSTKDLEDRIRLKLQLYKEYDLIDEEYSYEKMKKCFEEQKAYLEGISKRAENMVKKFNDEKKIKLINLMALYSFSITQLSDHFVIGFPLYVILFFGLFKFLAGFIPLPPFISDLWATGWFKSKQFDLATIGLLGEKEKSSWDIDYNILFIGLIGISYLWWHPVKNRGYYDGVGFTAFCSVYE